MKTLDNSHLRRRLMLDQSEKVLRRLIHESDWPFLGLYGEALSSNVQDLVNEAIEGNPTVGGYVQNLEHYPALFSVHLTRYIMDGFGENRNFEIYSHIARALHLKASTLSSAEKDRLWKGFRSTAITLGLEPSSRVSGPHYMVDEYLRQAGVPLRYAASLADGMLRFARHAGLPNDDDPSGITLWQQALDQRLGMPFNQTTRKAVGLDRQGYYTRVFLRLFQTSGKLGARSSPLEKAFAAAFNSSPETRTRIGRVAIPQIMMRGAAVGVFLPATESGEWVVTVDGTERKFRIHGTDDFVPFDKALPLQVRINDPSGSHKISTPLWEDEKSNRLLIFSAESGLLRARAQLAPADQAETSGVELTPGQYLILTRFEPTDSAIPLETIWEDPAVHLVTILLSPGQLIRLSRGPAVVCLKALAEPLMRWAGSAVFSREGQTIYLSAPFILSVEMPEELFDSNAQFELALRSGASGEVNVLPLHFDQDGRCNIDVSEVADQGVWRAGLWRVLAEVRRVGEARTLTRSSVFYWRGLAHVTEGLGFVCSEKPVNVVMGASDNVLFSNYDVICLDGARPTMRVVFNLDGKRDLALTWRRPGVFVEFLDYGSDGQMFRESITPGGSLVVTPSSAKQIVVSSSEQAILTLGDFQRQVDFSRVGNVTLAAASLADRITPSASTLVFRSLRTGTEVDLVRLIQPHDVLEFKCSVASNQLDIKFVIRQELEELAIVAQDILSGQVINWNVLANDPTGTRGPLGFGRLLSFATAEGGISGNLLLDLAHWRPGAWVIRFEAKLAGLWGRLCNARGDFFSAGLVVTDGGLVKKTQDITAMFNALNDDRALPVLQRLQESLNYCYAEECWDNVAWLAAGWKVLVDRWQGREAQATEMLCGLIGVRAPDSSSTSWIPQLSVISRLPGLFALRSESYASLKTGVSAIVEALRYTTRMSRELTPLFHDLLHPSVAAAFSNVAAMQRGESPKHFCVDDYAQALRETYDQRSAYRLADDSFSPIPGDFLGPLHLKHALLDLELRYDRSLGGNDIRRGQALGLTHLCKRTLSRFSEPIAPKNLVGASPVVNAWPTILDDTTPSSVAQRSEVMNDLAHLISLVAYFCRLEARKSGELQLFVDKLQRSDVELSGPLTFVLHVGQALFGFYLMLWELVLRADMDRTRVTMVSKPLGPTAKNL